MKIIGSRGCTHTQMARNRMVWDDFFISLKSESGSRNFSSTSEVNQSWKSAKYLEEQLVFETEVKHILHILILPGALRPSLSGFLNHSLPFPYGIISFLSKVEIPSMLSSLMLPSALPTHTALSCSSVISGHQFPFQNTSHHLKAKVEWEFQVARNSYFRDSFSPSDEYFWKWDIPLLQWCNSSCN